MTRNTRRWWLLSALASASMFVAATSARADVVLYGVSDSSLLQFNMTTQSVSVIGPMLSGMTDCEFDAGGTLWGTRNANLGGFPPTTVNRAYQINTLTGLTTPQGDFGSSATLYSLGFRPSNSTFYSVNVSGGTTTGHLVTDNLVAGTVTTVAGVPHGLPGAFAVEAVAFAPSGTLYGLWNAGQPPFGGNDYKLVTFNLASGLGTVIGSIASGQAFSSLRFDSAGIAYTVETNNGNVYTINTVTGQGTVLFAGGAAAIGTRGLAFIPAPGSTLLLAFGAALTARRRRR